MRSWKVIAALLLMWVLVMVYMTTSLMGGGEGTAHIERQLRRAMEELDMLHTQNKELQELAKLVHGAGRGDQEAVIQKLQERLQKATDDLEKLGVKRGGQRSAGAGDIPMEKELIPQQSHQCQTLGREMARRKAENTARELWYYINAKVNDLSGAASESASVKHIVQEMQKSLAGYQRVMIDDFLSLGLVDGDEKWRLSESKKLGDLVQRRLRFLQNPADCKKARVVVCDLKKGCGFGCQIHHVAYCLLVGYATERTLVLQSDGWRYAPDGWESVFQPLSENCRDASGQSVHWAGSSQGNSPARVLQLPIIDSLHPRPDFLPLAIPEDLAPRLKTFHGNPPVWWIGQLLRYIMRPQKHLEEDVADSAKKMGFEKPIVGVHIRRTDKVGVEAAYHGLEEYMHHVEDYYKQLEHRSGPVTRRVYLATDDPSVLKEAREKYGNYIFVSDNDISRTASLGSRYSQNSLRGIILDLHFLSSADYLVCTFSSQVCRVAYELMQTIHGDASTYFRSLDDSFYFGGQNAHNMLAVESHEAAHREEVSMHVGDLMGIAGNHWDGFSQGTNRRTGQAGLYPSYKVVDDIVAVKMPLYSDVKEEDSS